MCHYCKMTIVDTQHGAEAVTEKGRVYMFDAIECLVNYLEENPEQNHSFLLVNDFDSPKKLIDAENSHYLISKAVPSPMGAFLSGFKSEESAKNLQKLKGGEVYDWEGVKTQLRQSGYVRSY